MDHIIRYSFVCNRSSLVRERTAEVNRLHKVLKGANVKLGCVLSNIAGKSARMVLAALLGGRAIPTFRQRWPGDACGRSRTSLPGPCRVASGRISTSCLFSSLSMFTTWTRLSPEWRLRLRSGSALFRLNSPACKRPQASKPEMTR